MSRLRLQLQLCLEKITRLQLQLQLPYKIRNNRLQLPIIIDYHNRLHYRVKFQKKLSRFTKNKTEIHSLLFKTTFLFKNSSFFFRFKNIFLCDFNSKIMNMLKKSSCFRPLIRYVIEKIL